MISSQIKFDYFFESIREFTLSLGLVLIDNENQNPSIGTGGVLNKKIVCYF